MNLREQLKEILPSILPKSAGESIKGTELIKTIKLRLEHPYSDATLRYHFSVMSYDPTSPIAKVDQGQGYYLRSATSPGATRENQPRLEQRSLGFDPNVTAQDHDHLWLKFQAFFERYANHDASFVFPIHHGDLSDTPSDHFWTVPDAVVVNWKTADLVDGQVCLRPEWLCVDRAPFSLASAKLALEIHAENYRRVFFQCLSNSSWAHARELVIAMEVQDGTVVDELRRLGQRYGVGICSFSLSEEQLLNWAGPSEIRELPNEAFDSALRENLTCQRITACAPDTPLDWDHIDRLRGQHPEFVQLFRWIRGCLHQRRISDFSQFDPGSNPEE